MMTKYTIEYAINLRKSSLPVRFSTDDPVACEEALGELLERNFAVKSIKHEGIRSGNPADARFEGAERLSETYEAPLPRPAAVVGVENK